MCANSHFAETRDYRANLDKNPENPEDKNVSQFKFVDYWTLHWEMCL